MKVKDLDFNINDKDINILDSTNHLGLILDHKLNFDLHIKAKITSARKGITLIKRLAALGVSRKI